MKTKRGFWVKVVLVVLSINLIVAFYGYKEAFAAKEKIKVGMSWSLSGWAAPGAESEKRGNLLWVDHVNKKGGIYVKEYGKKLPVELVYYDDKSSPDEAIRIYEKLVTVDKVDVLFPPYAEDIILPQIPIVEKYHMPMVAATCTPPTEMAKKLKGEYFWIIPPLADRTMPALADLLSLHKDKIKTVAILYLHLGLMMESKEQFLPLAKKAGIEVVYLKDYPIGVKDMTEVLLEVKAKKPDAFLSFSLPDDGFLIQRQCMELGLDPKFYYMEIGPVIGPYDKIFGGGSEGILGHCHWHPSLPYPGVKEFYNDYMARWGRPDYENSSLGYMTGQIMEQAIEKAGTLDGAKVAKVIATEEFMTINGPVKFVGVRNVRTSAGIVQWQKGKIERVWPQKTATAPLLIPKPPWPKR